MHGNGYSYDNERARGEATAIIRETCSGVVVDSESVEQITAAILKLHEDHELYQQVRTRSIEAAPRYSRDIMAADMASVFERDFG